MIENRRYNDEMISTPSPLYDAKTTTILFATDFSPTCGIALNWAAAMARTMDARLLIVHVEQPGVPYGGGEVYSSDVLDQHSMILMRMLERAKPTDADVPYCHYLACGDPANEILRIAKDESVDMVVMSTHGRSGLPRVVNGSVAESVIRRANCPVLVFKSPLTILRYHAERAD